MKTFVSRIVSKFVDVPSFETSGPSASPYFNTLTKCYDEWLGTQSRLGVIPCITTPKAKWDSIWAMERLRSFSENTNLNGFSVEYGGVDQLRDPLHIEAYIKIEAISFDQSVEERARIVLDNFSFGKLAFSDIFTENCVSAWEPVLNRLASGANTLVNTVTPLEETSPFDPPAVV